MTTAKSYKDRVVARAEQRKSLLDAVDRLVTQRPADNGDPLVNDWACEALTAYHEAGRPDVDEVGEMLGVTLADEYEDALNEFSSAPEFRQALIDAVVSVSEMTMSDSPTKPSDW